MSHPGEKRARIPELARFRYKFFIYVCVFIVAHVSVYIGKSRKVGNILCEALSDKMPCSLLTGGRKWGPPH